ncbi:MAG: ATPase domain-containing protein [Bacteroidota bacterium]|jgi:DNA repair protein RadA/Sms
MQYECKHCHHVFNTFHLSCPDCGRWNSVSSQTKHLNETDARPVSLPKARSSNVKRTKTTVKEIDKVLGGGFVPGSSVLLAGPPGVGKSTFVIQILNKMNVPSLYVTGEESIDQLKLRANRLHIHSADIYLLFETNINKIISYIEDIQTQVLVVDSIQTAYTDASDTLPGSTTQIRKCTYVLRRSAQKKNYILLIIGQVTKDKAAAGPKLLEHAVDCVLHLEVQEETQNRILFASKNRFGSTIPKCILSMGSKELEFHKAK